MTWNALGEYADYLASEGELGAEANVRRARELFRAYEEARIVTDGREKGDRHARG